MRLQQRPEITHSDVLEGKLRLKHLAIPPRELGQLFTEGARQ
jgi:hypothetical protein